MMRSLLVGASKEPSDFNPDDLDEIDGLFFDSDGHSAEGVPTPHSAPVVALVCPKGGTGKTSIAVMLAGTLSTRRRRVGLLDLDPRQGVAGWSKAGNGLPFPYYSFSAGRGAAAFHRALQQAISEVDLLIVDTPPQMGPTTRLALQVADLVLIPAGASTPDLEAVQEAIDAAEDARHGRDGRLPQVKVVPSRQDARTRLAREFTARVKRLRTSLTPAVGQRVEVAAAADSGRLVRPGTAAGREFQKLSRHVLYSLKRIHA